MYFIILGTPIFDVKPYVPAYDTVSPYRVPDWIAETIHTRNEVIIPQELIEIIKNKNSSITRIHNNNHKENGNFETKNSNLINTKTNKSSLESNLREYKNDINTFIQAIIQTLEVEVRSKFQTKRRMQDSNNNITVEVPFDNTIVSYYWRDDRILEISNIELYDPQIHDLSLTDAQQQQAVDTAFDSS